jgi:hypothetical protein
MTVGAIGKFYDVGKDALRLAALRSKYLIALLKALFISLPSRAVVDGLPALLSNKLGSFRKFRLRLSLPLQLFQPHTGASAVLIDALPSGLGALFACNVRVPQGLDRRFLIFNSNLIKASACPAAIRRWPKSKFQIVRNGSGFSTFS